MSSNLRYLAAIGLFLAIALIGQPASADPALVRLVREDCGSCHGMTLKGGLGSPLTAELMRAIPRENLVATILHGRPGTAMPPWKTLLSAEQADWIAARLQEGFPEEKR